MYSYLNIYFSCGFSPCRLQSDDMIYTHISDEISCSAYQFSKNIPQWNPKTIPLFPSNPSSPRHSPTPFFPPAGSSLLTLPESFRKTPPKISTATSQFSSSSSSS
ncbi:unnamed protein product [Citrullus colocynthis]|uniref:Uncharacterized protein n=1 Tax=Citrullus colocynthis TaxID=252529 RepID=A0ABP0YMD3_9ROSI